MIIISFLRHKKTLNSYTLPALFSDFGYQNEKKKKKGKETKVRMVWY